MNKTKSKKTSASTASQSLTEALKVLNKAEAHAQELRRQMIGLRRAISILLATSSLSASDLVKLLGRMSSMISSEDLRQILASHS